MAKAGAMVDDGEAARGALCLNCGTRLIGAHCHACGQAGDVHRSVGAIGHEIAHGVFHFEGRIWRTLPLLVLRPGELTRRYIAGERARFVSPLALFLFTVFLMFAVYGWTGGDLAASVEQQAGRAETNTALADREARRGTAGAKIETNWPWLDRGIAKARANPGLVAYKVQSSAYKFSWALILLSTPFVALLFLWRRRYHLYDHAVFVTYSIAFMSLLVIALELLVALGAGGGLVGTAAVVIPPVHMFAQLRGAYRLSVFSALWRAAFLLTFSIAILILFVLGLLAMGVSG